MLARPARMRMAHSMNAIFDALFVLGRGVAALLGGFLPRRRWDALPGLPIEPLATVSGFVTLASGVLVGVAGFLQFAWQAAGGIVDTSVGVAERQVRHETAGEMTTFAMQGVSAFSVVAFLFFTPLGLFALYLGVTGLVRAVSAVADDPVGDPVLTGIDLLVTRSAGTVRRTRARRAREREEGPAVPDRLLPADSADLQGFDYVVVSSRRKPDWTVGTAVITSDKWYTLGRAFEVRLPEGLRTVYPLREQKATEVLRRGVQYELPPLEEDRPPLARGRNPAARTPR